MMRGGVGYIINVGVLAIYVILYREVQIDRCGRGKEGETSQDISIDRFMWKTMKDLAIYTHT